MSSTSRSREMHGGSTHAKRGKGKMSILDLGPVMFGTFDDQLQWMQSHSLLASNPRCSACGGIMQMQVRSDVQDGHR